MSKFTLQLLNRIGYWSWLWITLEAARQVKSCLGQVFNSKFGRLLSTVRKVHILQMASSKVKNSAQIFPVSIREFVNLQQGIHF